MNFKFEKNLPFGYLVESTDANCSVNELDIAMLRDLFVRENFVILRGFKTFQSSEEFSLWCERFGQISVWPFGKVLELVEHNNPEDHIFDNNYVPLHWDGMYRPQVPELQIFHCVRAPKTGQGGRTTFSHTQKALDHASSAQKALWGKVTGSYRRKMEFYDSKTISPIIDQHPQRGYSVIRYNEPPFAGAKGMKEFVNPPILEFAGAGESDILEAHRTLREALYSPHNFYAHEWQEGDIVLNDNYTLLHGREAFTTKAPRHLQRVHVLGSPALDNPRLVFHQ